MATSENALPPRRSAPGSGDADLEAGLGGVDGEVSPGRLAARTGVLLGQVQPDTKPTRHDTGAASSKAGLPELLAKTLSFEKGAGPRPAAAATPAPSQYPPPLRSTLKVLQPFFFSRTSPRRAWALAFGFLLVLLGNGFAMVWFSYLQREYTTALSLKDIERFYDGMVKFVILIALVVPIVGAGDWLKGALSIEWRRHLTGLLLRKYIGKSRAYYSLKQHSHVDNPDQRICEDVGGFTQGSVEIISNFLMAVVTLISGSGVLLSISPNLFLFLVVYTFVGTCAMLRLFGSPLMRLSRLVRRKEANLRFSLVRVRENAEAIAFYQGADFEQKRSEGYFRDLLGTYYRRLKIAVAFGSFNRFFQMFTLILPAFILGPMYLRGEIDFGAIAQVSYIFTNLLQALMTLASQMDALASVGAEASRICQLLQLLEAKEEANASGKEGGISFKTLEPQPETATSAAPLEVHHADHAEDPQTHQALKDYVVRSERLEDLHFCLSPSAADRDETRTVSCGAVVRGVDEGNGWLKVGTQYLPFSLDGEEVLHENVLARLRLDSVSLQVPLLDVDDQGPRPPLVSNISVNLLDGESLLICGSSGLGKSSLLRAIAGLWTQGSGSVERCADSDCFFVPQHPYMCLGTLRQQALYPDCRADDAEIAEALKLVNLEYLLTRHGLDTELDFGSVLSLGEQQRLGFVRLLLRRGVRLALLDEGTSALDEANEALVYSLLRQRVNCYVSVGHRPQLLNFHSHRLLLQRQPEGGSSGSPQRLADLCASPSERLQAELAMEDCTSPLSVPSNFTCGFQV